MVWQKGATYVELKKVRKDVLNDALEQAYTKVAIQKPAKIKKSLVKTKKT
jgi:hypothetical protein